MSNQNIAIDINVLVFMMLVNKFPTGINRVSLEYVKHYNKYVIVIFASFAEGFGLPLIEAINCGTPAIVSDIAPFHELGGDIPEYIDRLDKISWMNMILEYAKSESNLLHKQLQRLVGYQALTWEKHFELVDVIIGQLYEK